MPGLPQQQIQLRALTLIAAVMLSVGVGSPLTAQAAGASGPTCRAYHVPVSTTDGGNPSQAVLFGQLCYPGAHVPDTVELLVHGIAANHLYWDFPFDPSYYSYVDAATAAGYATFNVDRLGAGQSSRPISTTVDVASGSTALHSLIQQLRSGTAAGQRFSRVVWVGHSFGAILAWTEIARYHDVDGVILSGALHKASPSFIQQALANDAIPANLDPLFAGLGLDSGYLTTLPGTRASLDFFAPTADPRVIAVDEANKDTVTASELSTSLPLILAPVPDTAPSRQIGVPVLDVVGDHDATYCAADGVDCSSATSVAEVEAPYYSAAARLQVAVIPGTGHDLNLHFTAPVWFLTAQTWMRQHFPAN
jgi:pimeloyl-ACP methyl ester carboxylesterase